VLQRNPVPYLEMCARGEIEQAHLQIAEEIMEMGERFDLDAVREANQIGAWIVDPRWEFLPKDSKVVKKSDMLWEINGIPVRYLPDINTYIL